MRYILCFLLLFSVACAAGTSNLSKERNTEMNNELTMMNKYQKLAESTAYCKVGDRQFYFVDKAEAANYPQFCGPMPSIANVRCLAPRRNSGSDSKVACLVFFNGGYVVTDLVE